MENSKGKDFLGLLQDKYEYHIEILRPTVTK